MSIASLSYVIHVVVGYRKVVHATKVKSDVNWERVWNAVRAVGRLLRDLLRQPASIKRYAHTATLYSQLVHGQRCYESSHILHRGHLTYSDGDVYDVRVMHAVLISFLPNTPFRTGDIARRNSEFQQNVCV